MAPCHYRWVVFAITFFSYASTHACRQSFASAKTLLQSDWGFSKHFEGTMDGVFLFSYALGLFSSGVMGDKFDTASFHAFGLLMTSLIYLLFAVAVPYLKLSCAEYPAFYIALWILNGLIQSIGWPSGVKLIGHWFSYSVPAERKAWLIFRGYDSIVLIFGLWAAHQYLGNILGIAYVDAVQRHGWTTQCAFFLPAAQAFVAATLVLLFVRTYPPQSQSHVAPVHAHVQQAAPQTSPGHSRAVHTQPLLAASSEEDIQLRGDSLLAEQDVVEEVDRHVGDTATHTRSAAEYEYGVESDSDESVPEYEYRLSFKRALRLRHVVRYGVFFAMLKGVNYTIFFWFGYFGASWNDVSAEDSDLFLILFNVGSIVGGWVCGYLTDRYKLLSQHGRSPIILLFLVLSVPAVFALYWKPRRFLALYGLLCFAAGFFVGGPTNLISTVMATDVGKLQEIKGNPASFSTVSGIIVRLGSGGAAVSDYAASWISDFQTEYVYLFLAGQLVVGAFIILPVARKDMKGIWNQRSD